MTKLKISGYHTYYHLHILNGGVNAYEKQKSKKEKGLKPVIQQESF